MLESEVLQLRSKLASAEEALHHNSQAFAILQTIEASMEGPVPGLDAMKVRRGVPIPRPVQPIPIGSSFLTFPRNITWKRIFPRGLRVDGTWKRE